MTAAPDPRKLAVALEYDRLGAPRVTAKGRGALAERILDKAREHDIPIEDDSLLAEALSRVPLDDEIPIELYRAVATVIGFILATQRKTSAPEPHAAPQAPPGRPGSAE